jgi:AcrR family transcriptional regulator
VAAVTTRATYSDEQLLDAARTVAVTRGLKSTTVSAIAEEAGAPVGSIYHRFGSLNELLARMWIRAVARAQAAVEPVSYEDPVQGIVDAALAMFDFLCAERDDALLLGAFRCQDFDVAALPPDVRGELRTLNTAVEQVIAAAAERLSWRLRPAALDTAVLAMVDLPYGFVRSHLLAGRTPPKARRAQIETAVRALLAASWS